MLTNLVLGFLSATVYAQYISTIPQVIPLIHKAPYVNSWIDTRNENGSTSVGNWPQFFNGRTVGWMIAARVDDTGYILQGAHANFTPSKVNATFITSTRTIFVMDAGPVRLNLTYLTPIELDDWTRHSLPFGYFYMDLWSTDGKAHSVQLYSDISGEFVSPYLTDTLNWNTTVTSTLIYHQALSEAANFTLSSLEEADLTRDGTQFFAFRTTPRVAATWQSCYSEVCRNNFAEAGRLGNMTDTNFRAINNSLPVMAFALDLGNITQSDSPLVFAIGLFRNTAILYVKTSGLQAEDSENQISPWRRRWSNILDAIDSSLLDFPHTLSRANALDTKIASDTSALASKFGLPTSAVVNLTDLVIMNVRQTIGSLEITTNRTDQGPVNLDDFRVFMKDIGNSGRVNPVEVIYASFPAFLYLNSTLAGKLLEPLFEAKGPYNLEHATLDLGGYWPRARANISDNYPIGIEASGTMLILSLAYTQKSGDKSLISRYYNPLLKWAEYLVKNSVNLNGSWTADGYSYAMSNLALKGITGIYAMGKINQLLEGYVSGADANRTSYYLEKAQNYVQQWQNLSLSSTQDHIVSVFGDDNTWGLLYNLYAVRLIGADLIPNKVYELQASWYNYLKKRMTYPSPHFFACSMVGYDRNDGASKMHWVLLAAGSIFQDTTGTRDGMITNAHDFSFLYSSGYANPSTCNDLQPRRGTASAANGASFVFHALSLPNLATKQPEPTTPTTLPQPPNDSRIGYKLGIILATLVAIFISFGIFFYWRRLQRRQMSINLPAGETHITPYLGEPTTATHQSSKRHSETIAQQPNMFCATPPDQLDSHTKLSMQRGGAEVVHTSIEANGSNGNLEVTRVNDTQEENLRRQVAQLMVENEALRGDAIPPPYMDDI